MNQYQRYFAEKHLKNGSNVLIDYKDYILCENCDFSIDDREELSGLMKILSEIETDNISVYVLMYYDIRYFYADMVCITGSISDIAEKFSAFSSDPEIIASVDEIYLEYYNVYLLEKRKQREVNLREMDCVYLYWD
ncbi:MAG: hypothetical protein K2I80_06685 [Ruminococcus sp.]|nr:hypothetical protein [Ruminococcus sp.]MDE6848816.1 hypothetical protein [Ruminococcus sp.]